MGNCLSFIHTILMTNDNNEYRPLESYPKSAESSPKTLGSPYSTMSNSSNISHLSIDE